MLPGSQTSSGFFSIKSFILVALCFQNTSYTLLRKYATANIAFSSHGILLISELIKISFSAYMISSDLQKDLSPKKNLANHFTRLILESKKMFVLALIYAVMNILSFVCLLFISAGEFTVCAQLKILTTALSSRFFLGANISWTKWRALILLVLGCLLVASPAFMNIDPTSTSASNMFYGYSAVLIEVILSGFASTYFEKVIKNMGSENEKSYSIWERNFQLGFYSIITYVLYYLMPSAQANTSLYTDMTNFNGIIFAVAFLGALGGLLVAATLKYADSILKTLAASGAIVFNTYLSYAFLGGPMNVEVFFGSLVTVLAIMNYSFE